MATFKTGAIPSTWLLENRSSWNHATNVGRLRYAFKARDSFSIFPTGQAWWLMRNNADSQRRIQQIDLEEDRIRINIGSSAGGTGADLSSDWETKGVFAIVANGNTYKYELLSIDTSDAYNLAISANFLAGWQNFIENNIISRNPYRDARDVRDVEFIFWDGNGTNPFALPSAQAPTVGVNAIPNTNEGTTVQVSATETGGLYDQITRVWTASKGTIVQDDTDPKLAQWTAPNINVSMENANVVYRATVIGTGTNAANNTNDSASASHQVTILNVLSPAVAPTTVIIDIAKLIEQDAGYTVKLAATIVGGTADKHEYQWRVHNDTAVPVVDLSDSALDATDIAEPTLTYFVPKDDLAKSIGRINLSVTSVGEGVLADAGTSATKAADPVNFTTWANVALPDWRATNPLGVLDSDDVVLASAQEGHAVRLFAIRQADTGRFDDAEIDWEYSAALDDSNNRIWINLDDEVEDDPFAWSLPSVDVDSPIKIRARFKVLGTGTNARAGTETGWSAWRELDFTILTFHVKAPSTVDLTLTHNSGPKAGEAGTTFEAGSTARMAAVYASDGAWDSRDVVWGYIHNNNAVINAATSISNTSAIITMPNPTESSGDWSIWMYLEVTYKGTGTNARADSTVTETYYIKDITVRYPRPEVVLPTTLQIAVDGTAGIPDGNEGTSVTIGLIVTGGKFDSYTQEWSVLLGSENIWGGADDTETIDWTRPNRPINENTDYQVTCRVLFKGDGTIAKAGSEKVKEVVATATVINVIQAGIHLALAQAITIPLGTVEVKEVYLGDTLIKQFTS